MIHFEVSEIVGAEFDDNLRRELMRKVKRLGKLNLKESGSDFNQFNQSLLNQYQPEGISPFEGDGSIAIDL